MEAHQFLKSLVEPLVQAKDSIEVSEKEDELGILLSLKVHPSDM